MTKGEFEQLLVSELDLFVDTGEIEVEGFGPPKGGTTLVEGKHYINGRRNYFQARVTVELVDHQLAMCEGCMGDLVIDDSEKCKECRKGENDDSGC